MRNANLFALLLLAFVPVAACDDTGGIANPDPDEGDLGGEVAASGVPLSDVMVRASGPVDFSEPTRSNGQYAFDEVEAGTYTLTISDIPAGVTCPTTSKTVSVAPAEAVVVDFHCEGTPQTSLRPETAATSGGLTA